VGAAGGGAGERVGTKQAPQQVGALLLDTDFFQKAKEYAAEPFVRKYLFANQTITKIIARLFPQQ